jgi:hypothetical protein
MTRQTPQADAGIFPWAVTLRGLLASLSILWGLFFVEEADKISNLKLIEDLYKILLSIESEVFGA